MNKSLSVTQRVKLTFLVDDFYSPSTGLRVTATEAMYAKVVSAPTKAPVRMFRVLLWRKAIASSGSIPIWNHASSSRRG